MSSISEREHVQPTRSWLGVGTAVGIGVLGVATIAASLKLGLWTRLGPGPGFFPIWLGAILLGASIPWGLTQWRGVSDDNVDPGEEANGPLRIAAMVGSIVVTALLLEPLGFQLAILAFLFFHLRVLHRVRWIVAVPVMLAGSFGVFTLFDFLLGVPLPTAELSFLAAMGM